MRALAAVLALLAAPAAAADKPVAINDNVLWVETTKGPLLIELVPEAAPAHVARVKELVREGYYDGARFYRVVPNYIAQTGEKRPDGVFPSGKGALKAEFTFEAAGDFLGPLPVVHGDDGRAWAKFCPGVLAMAHYADPDSGDSQFFVVSGYAPLEKQFTVFGRVIDGLDAVRALNPGEPPAEPDRMTSVRLLEQVERTDTAGPEFRAKLAEARKTQGAAADCAAPIDAEIVVRSHGSR